MKDVNDLKIAKFDLEDGIRKLVSQFIQDHPEINGLSVDIAIDLTEPEYKGGQPQWVYDVNVQAVIKL